MRTISPHTVVVSFAAGMAALLVAAGAAAGAPATLEVPLAGMGGSSEHGVAVLKASGAKTVVTIKVSGGTADPQPSHFHSGTCDKYSPRPLYMLQSIVNGESTTTLDVPLETLAKGDLVINVHRSLTDIATVAACGVAKEH